VKSWAQSTWQTLRTAASDWMDDKASQLGAALAFYSALSLAPLVVIVLSITALFVDARQASEQFLSQTESMVGAQGTEAIRATLEHADKPKTGTLAAVLGVVTLLFGASGVFAQLQEAMNTIFDVPAKATSGIWATIRGRFLSMTMVLGTAFLLLISLLLSAFIAAVGTRLGHVWPALEPLTLAANAIATFVVMTLLFALTFKLLPDAHVPWRAALLGAFITAVLFTIGKLLIGLYLGKAAVGSAYGAAGSFVVLLVWIYYSAQILFFGAELTQVLSQRQGEQARS
jgi:membrane protein